MFRHLVNAQLAFDETVTTASNRAESKIEAVFAFFDKLRHAPFRGVQDTEIQDGLRHLTSDRAIIYFNPDERDGVIRVLGVFYCGQDHTRHMMETPRGAPPRS